MPKVLHTDLHQNETTLHMLLAVSIKGQVCRRSSSPLRLLGLAVGSSKAT